MVARRARGFQLSTFQMTTFQRLGRPRPGDWDLMRDTVPVAERRESGVLAWPNCLHTISCVCPKR